MPKQKKQKKILYIYAGKRKDGEIGIDFPDTPFYGINYIDKRNFSADYKELKFFLDLDRFLGFKTKHFFMFFKTFGYDLVFGPALLYQAPLKKIFKTKSKFILLNIYLNRLLQNSKKNSLRFKLIKSFAKQIDGIVCLSNYQQQNLIKEFNISPDKLQFIPLGVDVNFHKYIPDKKREDFVLSVGSDNGRDYQALIETANLLPKINFVIVCASRNLENIKHIPENVKIHYKLSPWQLRKLYQKAGILLLSTYADNQTKGADCSGQTVLLDAMASGIPVIATHKAYLSDYAEAGKEIIIVPPGSTKEIKTQIELLLESSEAREELALNARKKVENNFTTQDMARNLASYFNKFL